MMESLPIVSMIEFNSNTLQDVRCEFNLDKPERMKEAIDILDDWVKKQNHFVKKDFSRDYLERTLVATKGLVERAKVRLDRYCTFKTIMPSFFADTIENSFKDLKESIAHAQLPKMSPDNYRIYLFRVLKDSGDLGFMFNYYKYLFVLCEYAKTIDYCKGFVIVIDCRDVSIMNFVSKFNVIEFRQAFTILMEGYGMRIKGIHFVTPSKMVDALVSIFKSVLSEKMSKRIHVHKTVDSLYDHVPRDILPEEYGGIERPLKTLQDEWFKAVASKDFESLLRELHQARTDESSRMSGRLNDDYVGMPGSFRSLSVD